MLRAMYGKALVASVLCDSFGRGFYFGTYDYIKSSLASTDAELTLPHRLLAACLSGTAGWTSIYFLDTLRSRIMAGFACCGNEPPPLFRTPPSVWPNWALRSA